MPPPSSPERSASPDEVRAEAASSKAHVLEPTLGDWSGRATARDLDGELLDEAGETLRFG